MGITLCKPSYKIREYKANELQLKINQLEKESLQKSFIIFHLQEKLSKHKEYKLN